MDILLTIAAVVFAACGLAVAAEFWAAPLVEELDSEELFECGWCGNLHQFGVDCGRKTTSGDLGSHVDTVA